MTEEKWDNFVEQHPDSCFFHQFNWRKVIENVYGFKSHYIITKDKQGNIQGILPLFETKTIHKGLLGFQKIFNFLSIKQLTGKKLISVPFSTQGGILYNSEKARDFLLEQAKVLVLANNLDYLELRQEKDIETKVSEPSGEGIGIELQEKDYYYHMKLKLDPDPNVIWKNMNKKTRNAVRKARRLGLKTSRGLEYLDEFYKIFAKNMRNLGTPVEKKKFFQEIITQFPEKVDIVVAKLNKEVIGAVFLLKHKNTIKSEWASSLRKYFGYNANQIMYWRVIRDACKQGIEIFDFGRSVEGEGTYLFKKKFGAKPVQLHYKYFINNGEMPDTRKTNWKRKLFASTWSKMPLFITNKLGPKLRKEFP